ncbi:MAG TPA: ABC transporter substrate-binding protein [Stackebrandtia sp.]|jgi:NitT/TauT family transport system substrate-binding protein|uniref:ABC transporter substrate-binding protein n=1 Tax=Stackebrandtia sp. TaxID=2023065 RepID=UPI002D6FDFC5|nr:ABC transporter substrate-binding protein [Stackebrandtia sp.]HZE38173.1 ABC transporter substrate-binding protein [Stackebrandtia sp.]
MTPRWPRLLALAAALALAIPALASCGGTDDGKTLKLGYFPNVTHAPALVGVEKGFFADALGKDVKLKPSTFNAGPAAMEALFSGAVDATYIGPNPAINGWAKSKGQALRIVAGATSGGAGLVVRQGIDSVKDLRGKKIATPQLGNTQDVALRYWLKQHGYKTTSDKGGDVSVVPTDNADVANAFSSGAVDGAWVPEPYLSRLVSDGGGRLMLNEKDLWPHGDFVTTHLVVRSEFLTEHPDLVKKLLKGHIRAVDYIDDSPGGARAAVNRQLEKLSGKPLSDKVLKSSFANLTFTVDPIASSLKASAKHAQDVGLLDPVNLKGIYDLGPLNTLLKADGDPTVSAGKLGT